MRGRTITNPHPALVMFSDLERMKWSHLPLPGALANQDPGLMDLFRMIWSEQADYEAEEQKKHDAEQKRMEAKSRHRPRGI